MWWDDGTDSRGKIRQRIHNNSQMPKVRLEKPNKAVKEDNFQMLLQIAAENSVK